MLRRGTIAVLVVALWCVTGGADVARAQDTIDQLIGRTITAVRFEIDGRLDTATALPSLVDVKVGDPLRLPAVRSSVQRLASAGTFEDDVSVSASDEGGGVAVLFKLSARHPVDRLDFQQDTGLDPKELQRRVKDQYGGLPTNVPPGKVAQSVREILIDEGYLAADVTYAIDKQTDQDRATLVFNVAAGSRATITEATINNRASSVMSDNELRDRTGIQPGRPYRLGDINRALAAIRDDLQARRYYAAVASIEPVVSPDLKSVVVTLTVDAGPRVEVRWTGDPRPTGNEADLVPIARERAVDDDLLEDSRVRIEDALKADGYVNAGVTLAKDASTPGVLVVTYDVKRGPRFRVDHVAIPDGLHLTTPTIEAILGVKSGDVYNASRIDSGLVALRAEYRRRGYYKIAATADRQTLGRPGDEGDVSVVVQLRVVEGPEGFIAAIQFARDTARVPESGLRARMRSREREPYVPGLVLSDQDALSTLYLNQGFRTASVGIKPAFSADGQAVTLVVEINEGPQITVADIQVIGNQQVSDRTVIEAMTLKPGDPFGEEARLDSQQRINALGLFRRASVDEAPRLPGETRAHVIVTVEEAPAHTISYGGGVDAGRLSRTTADGGQEQYVAISPRAFFAAQRRNLWGRNSSIDFFSRVALKPTSDPSDPTRDGQGYGFTEYRVTTAYREPRAFKTKADLTISATFEQGLRPTFNFLHKNATAELTRRLSPRLTVSARYALDYSRLFDTRIAPEDQLTIDRAFPQVRLSLVSGTVVLDRRNDPVSPSHGTFSTADFEVAGRAIGSEIGYVKTFLQTSYFQALSSTRRFVFAGRAELGLAQGFPRLGTVTDANGNPQVVVVDDLPASQRFFAGGSSTVRGFPLDQLGVPEILDENGLSNGGNGLLIFNAELRTLVGKLFGNNFGVACFTDAGNVFQNAHDVDLSRLRGSAGFGLRYDSPIGPVRLDYGWKFSRMTFPSGVRERGWEFHFNIGEAF
jgi:outer membrane protein insertion porin family